MIVAGRVSVIDPNTKQNRVLSISNPLDFIGSHNCRVKFRVQCHAAAPKGVWGWEDHESLATPNALIDEPIERVIEPDDVHIYSGGRVDGWASPNVGYSNFNFIILPSSWPVGVNGKGYTNPWSVGALAGPVRDIIGSFRNVERLQHSGSLRLTSRSKPVCGLTGSDGRSRLFLHRVGLHFGSIGASLNSAQLPGAIFGEISSRLSLATSSVGKALGGDSLRLSGDPQFVHCVGLGFASFPEFVHGIGLRLASLLQFVHGAGLRVASTYEAPGSGHEVLRVLRPSFHLVQLGLHDTKLLMQINVCENGNQDSGDGCDSRPNRSERTYPFRGVQLWKYIAIAGAAAAAYGCGLVCYFWIIFCAVAIRTSPLARLNHAWRTVIGCGFAAVSVFLIYQAVLLAGF